MSKAAHKIDATCSHCAAPYRKRADRVRSPDYCTLACRKAADAAERERVRGRFCENCGKGFVPRPGQLSVGQGRFCSHMCASKGLKAQIHTPESRIKAVATFRRNGHDKRLSEIRGPKHPQFAGRKVSSGYVWVWDDGAYIQEHRLVMQRHLGRRLSPEEIVHHINRNRQDNRLENLQIMSKSQHALEHVNDVAEARKGMIRKRGNKLHVSTVSALKADHRNGMTNRALAAKYGITETMVGYIVRGKNWAHAA